MTELLANSSTPGVGASLANLTASLSPSAMTMAVNAPAITDLRSAGTDQFRVVIDSEILVMQTSATGASPWTILTRGAEGSTAATHATGTPVYHFLTAGALDARYSAAAGGTDMSLNTISGVGNLPAAYTLDLSAADVTIMGTGTLVSDVAMTVTGLSSGVGAPSGTQAVLTLIQDATGGHALSIIVNGKTSPVTTPPVGAFVVELTSTDGNLFIEATAATIITAPTSAMWTGAIAPLVNNQLDTTAWPYQSVTPGHLTVLADPLGVQGTVVQMAITETG